MTTTRTARATGRRLIVALLLSLCLVGCAAPGDSSHVVIEIGPSQFFTEPEIRAAAAAVMAKFKDLKGCELLRLEYDEAALIFEVDSGYFPRGAVDYPPATTANAIVFQSEYYAGPHSDGSVQPNATHSCTWYLRRSGPGSNWRVVDWGQG